MNNEDHVARQQEFYDTRAHDHLQPQGDDRYAAKLAARLAASVGLSSESHVLEVGAGFGRFTFPLLEHCGTLVAADLSPAALAQLDAVREQRGIDSNQCRTLQGDLDTLTVEESGGPFDAVVGFFLLHHLHDSARSIAHLARLLRPGGRMGFIEPNRRNPSFLLQVACCPDMTWAEERGMFTLSRAKIDAAYHAAGLRPLENDSFGFFPPQVLNRFDWAGSLEDKIEAARVFEPVLPFLLLCAESPHE